MWNFELKFAPVEIIGMLAFVERRTNWSLSNTFTTRYAKTRPGGFRKAEHAAGTAALPGNLAASAA
jgi:hypothetical protein